MVREYVEALRRLMKTQGIEAYIVPSTDAHQSEYLPELWQRRRFITGFTGSAGDAVITGRRAGLWTDSRYFIQAEAQLDSKVFSLFKIGMPDVPSYEDWLADELEAGQTVGVDTRVFSHSGYGKLQKRLEKAGVNLRAIEENLVDAVWEDRPARPLEKVQAHDERYAGESLGAKIERLRARMKEEGVAAHVVTMLDAVAWLFNIRGRDVAFNPVTIAYAIVTENDATLYIDKEKVDDTVSSHLGDDVILKTYEDFADGLKALEAAKVKTWIDPNTCSQWVVDRLLPGAELISKESPITRFKAVKNAVELEGMRAAHVRDGVAMVRFLIWLEKNYPAGGVTELKISEQLRAFRAQGEGFQGESFESIVGFGEHGAIVHYASTPETDVEIKAPGILLVDSGGQYLDGTTDITRTLALGEPTAEQRDRFTRVLKGHVCLTRQPYPKGTDGVQLDTLARMFLWEVGLNFGHGIGHGIGAFLNVHEMPPAISFLRGHGVKSEANMVVTNEPGYYKEGEYGFRQENVMVVEEVPELSQGDETYLRLAPLTLCPVDLSLVEKSMLSPAELEWLNSYHQEVYDTLKPLLEPDEVKWLEKACRAL